MRYTPRILPVFATGLLLAGVVVEGGGCEKRETAAKPAESAGGAAQTAATPMTEVPSPSAGAPDSPESPQTTEATNVQKLPSGVIIEDITVGQGEGCPPNSTVTIHYRGTLLNGKEFDSSYSGEPATFPLARLIKGWQEGIPGMKVGGKRKLTIPYQLAYGAAGSPPEIPPKSDLIFEIEMFEFTK